MSSAKEMLAAIEVIKRHKSGELIGTDKQNLDKLVKQGEALVRIEQEKLDEIKKNSAKKGEAVNALVSAVSEIDINPSFDVNIPEGAHPRGYEFEVIRDRNNLMKTIKVKVNE